MVLHRQAVTCYDLTVELEWRIRSPPRNIIEGSNVNGFSIGYLG
jgi:hypothetical protein